VNPLRATSLAAALACVAALAACGPRREPAPPASAPQAPVAPWPMGEAKDAGVAFGSRDPRTCPTIDTGTLTEIEATQLFICDNEAVRGAGDALELVSAVTLNLGPARPSAAADQGRDDIDATRLVYPIFGSYRAYDCAPLGPAGTPGANCTLSVHARAVGACYVTEHSGWHCAMADPAPAVQQHQPPPLKGA
jgi:hypothetical protein